MKTLRPVLVAESKERTSEVKTCRNRQAGACTASRACLDRRVSQWRRNHRAISQQFSHQCHPTVVELQRPMDLRSMDTCEDLGDSF